MTEGNIVARALAIADPVQRAAYLAAACADDHALRHRVEARLRAHADASGIVNPPAATQDPLPMTTDYRPAEETVGVVIAGRYKLLEQIGEGGMGTVWMAEQREPVKRLVGLKLIKPGMDSKAVLARFEAERQALALMDHPNIAKVLDGGTTEHGRPYFAMELVKGLPLTGYCDSRRLTVNDRLALFVQVCQAMQHAHQKGIIHRDLKPSNVLVTEHDGKPVPKVIDFGLAKALFSTSTLTERTLHTAYGTVVGTPLYMAPEQVGINALDVDTRTDIYTLGVILYELLTGTTPLEKKRFREAAWDEIRRVICEEEPPRPSNRLSSSGSLPSLAAQRQTEPAKLSKLVRGELDWIVLKALEKDRNRRYETANGFAMDVQRYLAGEPVLAVPPSASYRLRKLARKHRAGLTAAAALVALLVAGVAVSMWQMVRAKEAEHAALAAAQAELEQRQRAEAAEVLAKQRLSEATAAKERADRESRTAKAVNDFLQQDLLRQVDSRSQADRGFIGDPDLKVKETLNRAAARIGDRFRDQPLVEAAIRKVIGDAYRGIGEPQRAVEHLERARLLREVHLGADDPETLDAMHSLGLACLQSGQHLRARDVLEQTLAKRKLQLGPENADTLTSMHSLAIAYVELGKLLLAAPLLEQVLSVQQKRLGAEHADTLKTMESLGGVYRELSQFDKAISLQLHEQAKRQQKFGPDHPDTLSSMADLGFTYTRSGQFDKAVPLLKQALAKQQETLGPNHPDSLSTANSLGDTYRYAWQAAEAIKLLEPLLKTCKAKYGPSHPATLDVMNNLALAYDRGNRHIEAINLLEETLALLKNVRGPEHRETLNATANLARAHLDAHRLDLALPMFEELLPRCRTTLGPDDIFTNGVISDLMRAYQEVGKPGLALPLALERLDRQKEKLGIDHLDTVMSMDAAGYIYWRLKQYDQAISLFEKSLSVRKLKLPEDHVETLRCMANLGVNYKDANRLTEALPLLEEVYRKRRKYPSQLGWVWSQLLDGYVQAGRHTDAALLINELVRQARKDFKPNTSELGSILASSGSGLLALKRYADAEPLLRECLTIREKLAPDAWTTANAKSMLGGALLGQQKYAEAETLLVAGYKGLKKTEATLPANARQNLLKSLERLVQLYEALDKKEEAARWKREQESWKASAESAIKP
jgi:tetratricopeptide (TPR) repeat protein